MHKTLLALLLVLTVASGCSDMAGEHHVQNDPGGSGETGAIPNQSETHASGALSGFAAANGDPISPSGNLGAGSASDPENGVNSNPPGVRF